MNKLDKLLNEDSFENLMADCTVDVLAYLLDNNYEFGILCNLDGVEFEDELPKEARERINQITLFMIAGYTFESAEIDDNFTISFEAGFGSDGFGTIVRVAIDSILQIIVNDTPIFLNLCATNKKAKKVSNQSKKADENKSKNIFLNHPENQNIFKK